MHHDPRMDTDIPILITTDNSESDKSVQNNNTHLYKIYYKTVTTRHS